MVEKPSHKWAFNGFLRQLGYRPTTRNVVVSLNDNVAEVCEPLGGLVAWLPLSYNNRKVSGSTLLT